VLRTALTIAAASSVPGCAPTRKPKPRAVVTTMPFERIAYGTAPQQFADLRRPPGGGPGPVVIVLHGGFWQAQYDLGLMVPACEALAREGISTWNVEYRRVGDPGGGWPGTFLDVGTAADHLRRIGPAQGLDVRHVVTMGHSAGGQLALWLAGRRWIRGGDLRMASPLKVHGALSLAGIVDLRRAYELGLTPVADLMGGAPDAVPERYQTGDPAALIPLAVPQILVHGSNDTVVPESLSAQYARAAAARGDEVRFVPLPGTGHAELIDPTTPAWATVRESLRTLLA
jgi:acetyl esterase/lipase